MPTNTAQMTYDSNKHLYILDVEHINNTLGIDLVSSEGSMIKAKDKCFQISRTIYNFIYKHTHYKRAMEYHLAFDKDVRPIIQRALEEQTRYEDMMNAQFLAYQSGVNVLNGVSIPLDRFRGDARISPDAHDLLRNEKLLYTGQVFRTTNLSTYNYEEMGY